MISRILLSLVMYMYSHLGFLCGFWYCHFQSPDPVLYQSSADMVMVSILVFILFSFRTILDVVGRS